MKHGSPCRQNTWPNKIYTETKWFRYGKFTILYTRTLFIAGIKLFKARRFRFDPLINRSMLNINTRLRRLS